MSMSVRAQASSQQGGGSAALHLCRDNNWSHKCDLRQARNSCLKTSRWIWSRQCFLITEEEERCMRWWRWLRVVSTCLEGSRWPQRSTLDKSLHDPTSIDLLLVSVLHRLRWGRISSWTTFIIILINCRLPAPGPSFLQMWRHLLVNVTRCSVVAIVN